MNRTLMLAFFTLLSFSVTTATTAMAAETMQKQETEKSATKPATTQPATTQPATTQPATTQPATTQPAATKPATAQPAATKPEAAKPAEEISVILNAPLFSPLFQDVPVASVDDEIIPLRELNEALASMHESDKEDAKVAKIDYKPVLDRLINVELINMEADDMELDKLPEVRAVIDKYADNTLRQMLRDKETKDLVPDKEVVEKYYKAAIKEFKIKSVIFGQDKDAKKMAADLKSGKDFDSLAKKAIADKTASGGQEGQYTKLNQLLTGVDVEVGKLKPGEVTPVIKVKDGYTLVKVEDIRYPEDANAKKEAENQALLDKKRAVIREYFAGLKKKYVNINNKLFKSLNFEKSEAAFSKLLKDKRPLIKIKDEKPITVGDFTDVVSSKFYHGISRAIEEKKVNERKDNILDEILYTKLFLKEAKAQGIDKTPEYKNLVAGYKRSVLFGVFIQKAVAPDIKVKESDSKKYYDEHISDYTTPAMMKLYSLGFYKVKDAEDTLKKLQRGDDFKWLQSNASGQLKEDEAGALFLNGDVFTVTGLDEGLKKALTGVKTGDYRLYSSGKFSYVIYVKEDIPPQKEDYIKAREDTARKVYSEKIDHSIQDWVEKLRQAHKVRVYITGTGIAKTE